MDKTKTARIQRRFPIGCETQEFGAHFRVWAPNARSVAVVLRDTGVYDLTRESADYFSGFVPALSGSQYRFSLNGSADCFPDPASRFQPDGPFGWSQVIDPQFSWTDGWSGLDLKGQIIYEMHIGTFSLEGTWASAMAQLPELASLGITILEIMPVADFPGQFGWGYDGVNLFAPCRLYGSPNDFRRFVDRAHTLGMGVILDVVYNHVGPSGNYLPQFATDYFHASKKNEWGDAINFDGPNCQPVREFYISNASYWIEEFHLDGLRLDATQSINDTSDPHIITEIGRAVRRSAGGRKTIVVAENEPQDSRIVRKAACHGFELDGLWNDDFHHCATVALTGRREAYYSDYEGRPQELLSAVKYGFLYQGQRYSWQGNRRGTASLDIAGSAFITFLQNHDQVANSGRGLRLHQLTSPGRWRALTALLLLGPGTPMLFQGQEFNAQSPFLFFADHDGTLGEEVAKGRREFLSQFPSLADINAMKLLADPSARDTFQRSKLNFEDRKSNVGIYALHKDLLRIRRDDVAVAGGRVDGSVLSESVFLIRFFGECGDDRLLLINLGCDFEPRIVPEPLIAPPADAQWKKELSTEDIQYGGGGVYEPCVDGRWRISGECAILLRPAPAD